MRLLPTVDIRNLTVAYGKKIALKNINLKIESKEYLVILGPTGAGKTTLLRTLVGLVKPKQGKIFINNVNITKRHPEEREMAYLPQAYSLFPYLNVKDNVLFSPRVRQSKTEEEMAVLAGEVLDMVGLRNRWDAYPNELSGGMMQRCALARAIATELKIFLLDEPLKALDARLRLQLRTELRKLVKDLGITCLHVTHDQEEALALADRILILNDGEIMQLGDPQKIYEEPGNFFAADFLGEGNTFMGEIIESNETIIKVRVNSANIVLSCYPSKVVEHNVIGTKVILSVKTESTKVFSKGSYLENMSTNKLKGIIVRHYYLGKFTNLEINIEGYTKPILAKISSFDSHQFPVNNSVTVGIDPDDLIPFLWRN